MPGTQFMVPALGTQNHSVPIMGILAASKPQWLWAWNSSVIQRSGGGSSLGAVQLTTEMATRAFLFQCLIWDFLRLSFRGNTSQCLQPASAGREGSALPVPAAPGIAAASQELPTHGPACSPQPGLHPVPSLPSQQLPALSAQHSTGRRDSGLHLHSQALPRLPLY